MAFEQQFAQTRHLFLRRRLAQLVTQALFGDRELRRRPFILRRRPGWFGIAERVRDAGGGVGGGVLAILVQRLSQLAPRGSLLGRQLCYVIKGGDSGLMVAHRGRGQGELEQLLRTDFDTRDRSRRGSRRRASAGCRRVLAGRWVGAHHAKNTLHTIMVSARHTRPGRAG